MSILGPGCLLSYELPCKHQKIWCRDFEGVAGVFLNFRKPMSHLVERDAQSLAEILSGRTNLRISILGLEKSQGLIVLDENKIDLPLFLVPNIHNFKTPQPRLREPGGHSEKGEGEEVFETLSRVGKKRPMSGNWSRLFHSIMEKSRTFLLGSHVI